MNKNSTICLQFTDRNNKKVLMRGSAIKTGD